MPPLAASSQSTPHAVTHPNPTTPCLIPANKSRKHKSQVFFNPVTPSRITTSKILCILIKPQHFRQTTLEVYLQPTFTAPLQWEVYLESSGTSAVELFCRNIERLKAAGYLRRRTLSWIFDRTLNTTLPNNLIIACRKYEEKPSIMGLSKGILDSPCLLIFLITVIPNNDPSFSIYLSNTRNEKKK